MTSALRPGQDVYGVKKQEERVLQCQGNPGLRGGACPPTTGTLHGSEAMPMIRTGQREGVPQDEVRTRPWSMLLCGVTTDESSCERHTDVRESWQPSRQPYINGLSTAARGIRSLGRAMSHGRARAPALLPH